LQSSSPINAQEPSAKKKKENQCAGDLVGVRTWLIIAMHKQM
jgi:hypothetical protein